MERRVEKEKERAKREDLIEQRKKKYYESLKKSQNLEEIEPKIHDRMGLTKLDSKRSSLRTLDHISELSRDLGHPLDLGKFINHVDTISGFSFNFLTTISVL